MPMLDPDRLADAGGVRAIAGDQTTVYFYRRSLTAIGAGDRDRYAVRE
jgi:hypothetical protein